MVRVPKVLSTSSAKKDAAAEASAWESEEEELIPPKQSDNGQAKPLFLTESTSGRAKKTDVVDALDDVRELSSSFEKLVVEAVHTLSLKDMKGFCESSNWKLISYN